MDDRHDLVLDEFDEKLEAFNVLRKSDVEAADQILGQVGATDDVDRQIILELASKRLLGHPDRFPQAHAGAMRALDDPDRLLLARARGQTNRVAPGYKGNPLGFPTFILGGAFLSTIVGSLQGIVVSAIDSLIGQIVLILFLFAFMVAASWAFLKGAAIARRRIKLTTDQPLEALYQTIGRCGRPPQDHASVPCFCSVRIAATTPFTTRTAWVQI